MLAVLLTIHMIACVALVIAVMLQRSEGGALGMGGGGTGGIISGRGAAGVLVRTTMILAAVFFTTSVVMTRLNSENSRAPTDLERLNQQQNGLNPLGGGATTPAPATPPVTTTPLVPTAPDPLAPTGSSPAPAPATTTTTTTPPA